MEAALVVPPGWTAGLRPEVAREEDGAEPATLMVLEVEVAGSAFLNRSQQARCVSV